MYKFGKEIRTNNRAIAIDQLENPLADDSFRKSVPLNDLAPCDPFLYEILGEKACLFVKPMQANFEQDVSTTCSGPEMGVHAHACGHLVGVF